MVTLREFILSQSELSTGNTIRDHIQNPSTGGGVPYPVYYKEIKINAIVPDIRVKATTVEVAAKQSNIEIEIDNQNIEIGTNEVLLEVDK